MGIGMIAAMRLFDTKRHEGVTMRVGIHTGSVLCGIVGTRRVKFDVWSNDVSLANRMESTGRPGQIHVSEKTYKFLENKYISEPGEEVEGNFMHSFIRIDRLNTVFDEETNSLLFLIHRTENLLHNTKKINEIL